MRNEDILFIDKLIEQNECLKDAMREAIELLGIDGYNTKGKVKELLKEALGE